ncbi:hypothetical protein KUTeg_022084 [Tegillarca granosa]|uniref:Protein kinase domain-containing protein n=1 Tax=Tegillarca granosa TaxID=220873 RepID=A0ABQ9EAP1_TEGGR|nr:hypothetical protein KUTeg_022084 [Tegillarca granosa]
MSFVESRFLRSEEDNMTKQPGNLRWMAPEIFTQCTKYSIKADIFSYSLCLWEILAGELPFSHLKPAAAAADMAYHNTRPPIAVTFPKPLVTILQRSWHANPEDRPEFKEIVLLVEECRQSLGAAMLSNSSVVTNLSQVKDEDISKEGRETPPLAGHVTALRTHWELEATRNSAVSADELRRRLQFPTIDKNGYVADPLSTFRIPVTLPRHPATPSSSSSYASVNGSNGSLENIPH